MKPVHYISTGLIAYFLFLVIYTPATAIHQFSNQMPQVKFQGLDGTLWNGSAQRITIASKHRLDDVDWSFCAWRLLTGEFCLDLEAKYAGQPVHAQLGAGLGGSLRIRNLATEIDARPLGKLLGLPLGELSGLISIDMSAVRLNHGSVPEADGLITWNNAAVTVAETAQLGALSIVLAESNEYPLTAIISNKGGHIALDGRAHVTDDGTYNLELNLAPNNLASKNISSSLEMFAKKQANGNFVLKNSGNLEQLGLM